MTKLLSRNIEEVNSSKCHNFYFDNEVWVGITPEKGTWEYQKGDDEETYMSGSFLVDGNTIYDYDGCYELPNEVIIAFSQDYQMDL